MEPSIKTSVLSGDAVRTDLPYYIEAFYNHRRLRTVLADLSPESYEQLYHQRTDLV